MSLRVLKEAVKAPLIVTEAKQDHAVDSPPWRQPTGNWMVSLVNSHTNATRIGWHLRVIDLRFAPELPLGCLNTRKTTGYSHTAVCAWRAGGKETVRGDTSVSAPPNQMLQEGKCKAAWKREFKLPWREAGPPNHHDDKVDSD